MKGKTRTDFWSSWTGATIVSLGIFGFFVFRMFGPGVEVSRRAEWQEVHRALTEGKWFATRFAFVAEIEPEGNERRSRNWQIVRSGDEVKGYFVVNVTGWRALKDERRSHERFIVLFRQASGGPAVITKIADSIGTIVFEEPNQSLQPTPIPPGELGKSSSI
jgi:hypothetical protein